MVLCKAAFLLERQPAHLATSHSHGGHRVVAPLQGSVIPPGRWLCSGAVQRRRNTWDVWGEAPTTCSIQSMVGVEADIVSLLHALLRALLLGLSCAPHPLAVCPQQTSSALLRSICKVRIAVPCSKHSCEVTLRRHFKHFCTAFVTYELSEKANIKIYIENKLLPVTGSYWKEQKTVTSSY